MTKKLWILCWCGLSAVVLLLGVAVYTEEKDMKAGEAPQGTLSVPSGEASPLYLIKNYRGKVAVFRFGESEPLEISQAEVKQLPEYDRILLEKGISVNSREELVRLLEDYSE